MGGGGTLPPRGISPSQGLPYTPVAKITDLCITCAMMQSNKTENIKDLVKNEKI